MNDHIFTIVVAEDEELLLDHLLNKIKTHTEGFKVVGTAQTGNQALRKVEQYMPDVLVTDIQMPHMNGIELLEQVHLRFPEIKTVILSGYAEFAYAQKAISYNVFEYLLKPIDPVDLNKVFNKLRAELQESLPDIESLFPENSLRTPPSEIAHFMYDYIQKNYSSDLSLNDVAKEMHYSYSYITKAFYKEYKTSPNKLLIQVRLTHAKQLLSKHYELNIHQVGEMVGYPDQSYFSRMFKKFSGQSPLEYRQQHLLI